MGQVNADTTQTKGRVGFGCRAKQRIEGWHGLIRACIKCTYHQWTCLAWNITAESTKNLHVAPTLLILIGQDRGISKEKFCAQQSNPFSPPLPGSLGFGLASNICQQEYTPTVNIDWCTGLLSGFFENSTLLPLFGKTLRQLSTHLRRGMLVEQALISIQSQFITSMDDLQCGLAQSCNCWDTKRTR